MTGEISGLSGLGFIDPQADPARAMQSVAAAERPLAWSGSHRRIDLAIAGAGMWWQFPEWRNHTQTTSLLMIMDDRVVHEWYASGFGPETKFLGASMGKSVLAHLVGRAVDAGLLQLQTAVVELVPELADSGYAGVRVIDLLTMTTGVGWNEDYRDETSAASRLIMDFRAGRDSRGRLAAVEPGVGPGRRFAYCTPDSQVLDWVRERATGLSYAEDLTRLWNLLGATDTAAVAVDGKGVALAGGGLSATTRDWARIAALARDGTAALSGERVLSPDWVQAVARPSFPFLQVGRLPSRLTAHAGFGQHWWLLDDHGNRVTADGSRGQFAAVDRTTGAIVVKTSLWPYGDFLVDRHFRDLSYLGLHALLDIIPDLPEEGPQP